MHINISALLGFLAGDVHLADASGVLTLMSCADWRLGHVRARKNRIPANCHGGRPPAVVMNIGMIYYDPALSPLLWRKVRKKLAGLQRSMAVLRVLHHSGGQGGDETALQIVRDLGDWQDHAHPESDMAIAGASNILIVVGPRPEQNADASSRAATWLDTIRHTRVAHVNIVYVQESSSGTRPASRRRPTADSRKPTGTSLPRDPRSHQAEERSRRDLHRVPAAAGVTHRLPNSGLAGKPQWPECLCTTD